jgi:RNA-directed DNA polymerase
MIRRDVEGRVEILDAATPGSDRKSRRGGGGASRVTAKRGHSHPETLQLMEAVVERENMKTAWLRVKGNKGAAGVDGMTVDVLLPNLREHWPSLKEDLLAGRYQPSPVRKLEIPKPSGGVRQLGIPTVLDRLIQQALHQVLQPIFDPTFSASSYGFRPGRGAHQAMAQAKAYVAEGKRWVVDLDLENFFDRVNHNTVHLTIFITTLEVEFGNWF